MIGWSPRTLVIDRFRLDYESAETNGLVWTDDLEVTHFQWIGTVETRCHQSVKTLPWTTKDGSPATLLTFFRVRTGNGGVRVIRRRPNALIPLWLGPPRVPRQI